MTTSFYSRHLPKSCSSSAICAFGDRNLGFHSPSTLVNPPSPDASGPPIPSSSAEDIQDSDTLDNSAMLKFISDILMEEDVGGKTCMLQDCLALQATEKPFYEAIGQKYPYASKIFSTCSPESTFSGHRRKGDCSSVSSEEDDRDQSPSSRVHLRDEDDRIEEERSNKQSATALAECDSISEIFDAVLLCPPESSGSSPSPSRSASRKGANPRISKGKRGGTGGGSIDLWTMLTQCAQAVASSEQRPANELLRQIRKHSSMRGDVNQRLAYYFSVALEARMVGLKTPAYQSYVVTVTKMVDVLRAYQMYVKACPFHRMSYFFANRTILKLAENATTLHIIDFGILYGFQWPCLIQRLSERTGGPPRLKITGIELPQPGFRPAQRVEETLNRLKKYCERFNVQFESNVIAKKWESIEYGELKISDDEVTVVNSMYRMKNVPDDTVEPNSPRDKVLKLIYRIRPDLFILGVVNGTYNAPFFVTRFREALFYYSAMFDMFDATVPRDDAQRLLFEKEVYGRDILNSIACEGVERVERPESYKQWQARNLRATFRQLPLDTALVEKVKEKIRMEYDKDYVVDEDGHWLLHGWKGRITKAVSLWKPA